MRSHSRLDCLDKHTDLTLAVTVMPSFDRPKRYILSKGVDPQGEVTYSVFFHDQSYQNPNRTAYPIDRQRTDEILGCLLHTRLKNIEEPFCGLDGTTYSVEVYTELRGS